MGGAQRYPSYVRVRDWLYSSFDHMIKLGLHLEEIERAMFIDYDER